MTETVQPLQNAATTAVALAGHYRRHDLSRGNRGLIELTGELRTLALRVLTESRRRGMDQSATDGHGSLNDHIGKLAAVLDTLIAAQAAEDWVTVADILEYDVEPAIRQWAMALEQLTATS